MRNGLETINENALQCCSLLKEYFNRPVSSLAVVEFPSSIIYGSLEWLIYIFYSCLLDYGMRSKVYHKNLINTYLHYPEIFNPKYVLNNQSKEQLLLDIIKNNIHPRYPNIALKKWILLSNELVKYDNLLETIKCFRSFSDLSTFIRNIHGYGQKTGGLLLRLIADSHICLFEDEITSIPLDRHDIEISYLNNIVDTEKLSTFQIKELSSIWIANAKKLNISPSDIDKYLWEVGNRFCNSKNCLECPLYQTCKTKISNKKLEVQKK